MKSSTNRARVAKKQSTSFAQVANNLLNVLQGYTNSIRLLLVMFLALTASTALGAKITTYSSIVTGKTYYIGATTGGTDYYLSVSGASTSRSIAGTAVTTKANATAFVFTGSGTSWKIKFADYANYLGLKSSKDNGKVQVVSSAATFTASNQSGKLRLSIGSYSIQKNNSGTQFGSYGNTQTDIWLEEAETCTNKVTIQKGTPSMRSFSISKTGTYETCDAPLVITLSNITPSAGYQFSEITQSGINSGVTIDQANKTVTYDKNTSGTSTINVTFEQKQSATITLSEAGVETGVAGKYIGDSYTLPSTTSQSCGDLEFVGWSTVEINNSASKPASNYYDKGASVSLKAGENKFYAVFATKTTTTGGTTTTPTSATLSFASKDQRTTYTTSEQVWEQNGITLTNNKGSSTSNVGDYSNPARFYKSSKITLSFTDPMTQIVFTCRSSDYATDLKNSIKSGATVTASGSTVTAELDEPAISFVISSLFGQVRMNSVEVTYESSTQGAQTTYSDYTTTCTESSTFTVTFNTNGHGTEPDKLIVASGQQATEPTPAPTATGYTFGGWYKESGCTNAWNFATDVVTKNTTLYAKWTAIQTTITLSANGGSGNTTKVAATYDSSTLNPSSITNPTKTGYTFGGWYSGEGGTGSLVINSSGKLQANVSGYTDANAKWINESASLTLYAQWGINTYKVTFNANNGSSTMNSQTFTYNVAQNLTANSFTRTGYTFAGWNTKADGSGTSYADKQSVTLTTAGLTLYAQWEANTYTIEFNANGGTGTMEHQSFTYGQSKALNANAFTRTNYAFKNWNTEADGSGTAYTDKQSVSNLTSTNNGTVTLYAQWTQLRTITWMVGGSELTTGSQTTSVENGKKITAIPADPNDNTLNSCGANEFMGWSTDNIGSTPDADAPTDLFKTVAEAQSKIGNITKNKIFYAVFATAGAPQTESVTVTQSSFTSTSGNLNSDTNISYDSYKGEGTTNPAISSNAIRLYQNSNGKTGGYIIIKAATGCTITSASITSASTYTTTTGYLLSAPASTPSKSDFVVSNYSLAKSSTYTVSGINTSAITFACFGTTSSTRLDIAKISVTYTKQGAPSYSNYVTNCCELLPVTNLQVSGVTEKSATLTWIKPSSTTGITELQIRNTNDEVVVDDINPTTTTATINGLDECTKYNYYVVSVGAECEVSSEPITAQPFSGAKTVTFNYNGNGQANTTASTSCGNTSITLPTPTWAGYRFMGWFNAASGGTKIGEAGASYKPTDDITLHAQWAKEYSVTYNANGGSTTCANGNYIEGETVTVCTTNPSRTGHTFTGWTYSPNVTITDGKFVMPASDVTITAQWQVKSYTVTWNPNGGNWGGSTANIVETYEYEAKIVQPAAPQRDGCRFTGWSPAVSPTMPAGDKTYTAQWKQNYTITFYDGDDVTPWTQAKDAESINLTEYVGTLACDDYQFAGWSTADTKYNDETANITTWVTGNYTPTANIDLYAVYTKGAVTNDFTLNCDGGVYEIWEKGHNQHMAGRQNGGGDKFYTTEYWDANNSESNGAPFTITKVADNTYTLQNADGQYITRDSYYEDELEIEETWENADRYKWTISNGTNGTWRFTNKAATSYALVYYDNRYFELRSASSVTAGNTTTYDLELTPAASNVYQSNPNCGPYTITFETGGGEFVQGNYKYSTAVTSNLTETTTTRFPAAELEGYTFAGWKDGAPQDDVNYEPYLKKADDNLVVSSNKTYYAVYYYYDEEEDIDWSKEFTTAIYADVNGIKYFLAGTPDRGTMSSTTDCGYVSEVTITPGTGANAGKYKITVNGVAMAPKTNETDLLNGTYWWTITERSVGSGEYKISGETNRNVVLNNSSFGHYEYNAQGSYNGDYHYVRFGNCREHHWASDPKRKPSIILSSSGPLTITSAAGQTIKSINKLFVGATHYEMQTKIYLTCDVDGVGLLHEDGTALSSDANGEYLTTTAEGELASTNLILTYSPTITTDGIETVTITAQDEEGTAKATRLAQVRHLPENFVIAAKTGNSWVALTANITSTGTQAAPLIMVDNIALPTKATITPNTTKYQLLGLQTDKPTKDNSRFKNNGAAVHLYSTNVSEVISASTSTDNNKTYINADATHEGAANSSNCLFYEWQLQTNDLVHYTLVNSNTTNTSNTKLGYSATYAQWGMYQTGNNVIQEVLLLPIEKDITEMDVEVMEWGTNSMALRFGSEAPATVDITLGATSTKGLSLTNLNSGNTSDIYKVEGLSLAGNDCEALLITDATDASKGKLIRKPILVSGDKNGSNYTIAPTRDVCMHSDIVILNGGKLTADEAKTVGSHVDFANIYVYPGGKLVLDGKSLGVKRQVYLRGGYSWLNPTYALPEVYVNGEINFNGSGNIIYDYYIQNYKYYQFSLPYQVPLAKVTDEAGVDNFPVWVKHYNGALRAADPKATSWEWYYGANFESGIGYIIAAKPRQVGNVANRPLSIIRFPLGNKAFNETNGIEMEKSVTTIAHGIDGYKAGTVTANNVGWNFIGNPFMATWKGDDIGHQQLMKSPDAEHWNGSYHWENNDVKYITVMSPEDGTDYDQYIAAHTELKPFFPFYLQETADGGAGTINFAAANRIQKAPAELYADEPREAFVQVEILTDRVEDQTGVFISDTYSDEIDFDDYEKMFGSSTDKPKVWLVHDNTRLAFEAMTENRATGMTPLGYRAPRLGKYTFAINEDVSALSEVVGVYLTDHELGVTDYNLLYNTYEFETKATNYNDQRFTIRIALRDDSNGVVTGVDNINTKANQPIKFLYQDKIYILRNGIIYDTTGKQVITINK